MLKSKQVQYWIHAYRELLNKFKLWEKRAEFDVLQMKLTKSKNMFNTQSRLENNYFNYNQMFGQRFMGQQNLKVHMSCNKCGKNLMEKHPNSNHQRSNTIGKYKAIILRSKLKIRTNFSSITLSNQNILNVFKKAFFILKPLEPITVLMVLAKFMSYEAKMLHLLVNCF